MSVRPEQPADAPVEALDAPRNGPTAAAAEPARAPYVAPRLEVVSLVADEAVLGFCKQNGTNGPGGRNCRQGGACVLNGS